MIHKFMHEHKVPDDTCISYSGVNQECTPLNVCRNCFRQLPIDPSDPFKPGPCWGMPTYIGYGVREYGNMSGELAMMKEIYARGPIACSGVTSVDFVQHFTENSGVLKDGVYRDSTRYNESDIDHIMEITGWGETANGDKYWIVRNSWGTYWGVAGWFKLERGKNSLLIEEHCDWAVPDFDDLSKELLYQVQGDYYTGIPNGAPNTLDIDASKFSVPEMHTGAFGESAQDSSGLQLPHLWQKHLDPRYVGLFGAVVGSIIVWICPRLNSNRREMMQPALLG